MKKDSEIPKLREGFDVDYLSKKWKEVYAIMVIYMILEGRYVVIIGIHISLMNHFFGRHVNFPFYFKKSIFRSMKKAKRLYLNVSQH